MNPARLLGSLKGNQMSETGEVRINRDMSLRAKFHRMPPKQHHRDPHASEVVGHIKEVLACDLDRALKAFNSMRNHRSQVLVFDSVDRTWHGCFWTPSEEEERDRKIWREMMALARDVAELKAQMRKLKKKTAAASRGANKAEETETVADPESPKPVPFNPGDASREFARSIRTIREQPEGRTWMGCCDFCGSSELIDLEAGWECAGCALVYTNRAH